MRFDLYACYLFDLIDNVPVALLDDQPSEKLVFLLLQCPKDRILDIPGRHYL